MPYTIHILNMYVSLLFNRARDLVLDLGLLCVQAAKAVERLCFYLGQIKKKKCVSGNGSENFR